MTPRLDFPAAEKEFRRALKLSPGDAGAKYAMSYVLWPRVGWPKRSKLAERRFC